MAHFTSLISIDSKCSRIRKRRRKRWNRDESEKEMGIFLFLYYLRLISWHFKHHFFFVMINFVLYGAIFSLFFLLLLLLFICLYTRIIFMIFLAKWFVKLFWCIHVMSMSRQSGGERSHSLFSRCFLPSTSSSSTSSSSSLSRFLSTYLLDQNATHQMYTEKNSIFQKGRVNLLPISLVSNLISKRKCQNVKRVEDFPWDACWIVKLELCVCVCVVCVCVFWSVNKYIYNSNTGRGR